MYRRVEPGAGCEFLTLTFLYSEVSLLSIKNEGKKTQPNKIKTKKPKPHSPQKPKQNIKPQTNKPTKKPQTQNPPCTFHLQQ